MNIIEPIAIIRNYKQYYIALKIIEINLKKEFLYISPSHSQILSGHKSFNSFMELNGVTYRKVHGRETLQVKINGSYFFIKKHYGINFNELIKNILSFKLPIWGARREWDAIKKLYEIGVPTTPFVAFGEKGCVFYKNQSFILTQDLGNITSLEDLCKNWTITPPKQGFKHKIIEEVANISGLIHSSGLNHRDFYLCHFCINNDYLTTNKILLYLIDLHRVGITSTISKKNQMKDLAALYFSCLNIGLNKRDVLRFIAKYQRFFESDIFRSNPSLSHKIEKRAQNLDKKFKRKWPLPTIK